MGVFFLGERRAAFHSTAALQPAYRLQTMTTLEELEGIFQAIQIPFCLDAFSSSRSPIGAVRPGMVAGT